MAFVSSPTSLFGFSVDTSLDYTSIMVPGAASGEIYGTTPTGINDSGKITGVYQDATFFSHGFIRY
jgi:hypothetical protein